MIRSPDVDQVSLIVFRDAGKSPGDRYYRELVAFKYGKGATLDRACDVAVGQVPDVAEVLGLYSRLRELGRLSDFGTPTDSFNGTGPDGKWIVVLFFNLAKSDEQEVARLNREVVRLCEQARYQPAMTLAKEVADRARQHVARDNPEFANSLNNLAAIHHLTGDYAEAESLYKQTLEIARSVLGERHPRFASALHNLAALYGDMGDQHLAESLDCQGLEIREAALGEHHPDVANSLNNLATRYHSLGNYAVAERMHRRALEIRRNAFGDNHPHVAQSLNNLAEIYRALRDYDAAEPLYRQASSIWGQTLGEEHPEFAASLQNLALLYLRRGDPEAAAPLCRQALRVLGTALGENHPTYAEALTTLADLHRRSDDAASAEPLYRQAVSIWRTSLGAGHPHVATGLHNLAGLYRQLGVASKAEPLLRQAVEICRHALGESHPEYVQSLYGLGGVCACLHRESEALDLMGRAAESEDQVIGNVSAIASESQRAAYLASIQGNLDGSLSLIQQYLPTSPEAVRQAFDLVLRRKALGMEALAAQRDGILIGRYVHLQADLRELTALRMQIAQKTLAGPSLEGGETHRQLLMRWNTRKEQLERQLASQIPELNLQQRLQTARLKEVALHLPKDAVLVEFVRFRVFDFQDIPALEQARWQDPRYLAFVLVDRGPNQLQMFDLGAAEKIDRLIAEFRSGITEDWDQEPNRDMVKAPRSLVTTDAKQPGQMLRASVFDKLRPALNGRERILLAPDGDLCRLPFEVLPTDDGRRLIDDYSISYLGCGRDILRFQARSNGQITEAIVAADPDFDLCSDRTDCPSKLEAVPGRRSRDLDEFELSFDRLPGTRMEGEQVARLLGVRPWFHAEVLEKRLKEARSPWVLHLATHGFFLPDQRRDADQEFSSTEGSVSGRFSGLRLENPLLRSGLALAGGNTWLNKGQLPSDAEDGLLTAEDVTGIDLLDTEMVVLSACNTGLGEIRTGEGVFGLRRAFVLAGAKTIITSLWKVPDEPTRELMEDFYRRVLSGQGRAVALRNAQLALKAKYPEPYYWGAFICQGDPGLLCDYRRPARPSGKGWYFSRDGNVSHGPISSAELQVLVRSGRLKRAAKVSRNGQDWRPASHLRGVEWPEPEGVD